MPPSSPTLFRQAAAQLGVLLFFVALLPGCYAVDSATSACRQNPAYCTAVAGEETVVPVRGAAEIASVAATLRVLSADQKATLEQALVECAQAAEAEVNRRRLGGQSPSRAQCQEVLPEADACGKRVTRAMQWGSEKHAVALQCAQERLGSLMPGRFSLEQRYRNDGRMGQKQLVSSEEARALLRKGCSDELVGTIVPDVVIHSGDPLEILNVYDFKFTCPLDNPAQWRIHPRGHVHADLSQGAVYYMILEVAPALVSPLQGIIRWIASQQ